ncbi:TPA: restriction endonuclease subunit S [Proteus mirabilis]|nr:restriction endonuclease subunit S [Providencia rettgeri]ELR5195560.1 restriction endonuclease subunit S [Providencia rettgeri]
MEGRYKTYPEYKESYQKWIGEIPSHWNIWRAKRVFSAVREPAKNTDEQLAASQKYGVIPQSLMMELNSAKVMLALKGTESFRHVEQDNFVISLRSFEGGIEHSAYEGCVSPAYTVLKASKFIYSHYFKYLLKCEPFIAALQSSTDSLRDGKSISYEQFGAISLPYCNHEEQKVIADFLDHETTKIDNLIAKQEKLIELLKEKRQAVISNAVTKGLNPDVPMKDSGVEWLGEVPEHWDRSRLGFECSVKARLGWKGLKADEYVPEGYIFLATPNIKGSDIDFENVNYITKQRYDESPEIMLQENDLLVTKDGSTTGTTNLVRSLPEPATVNSSIAVIRSRGNIHPEYLYYFFVSTYTQNVIKRMQGGMGVPHLFQADLRWFHILLPSNIEQKSIAKYLDIQTAKCDLIIKKATNAIQLMKERKTALILAAVTGKIDVRDWQPKGIQ